MNKRDWLGLSRRICEGTPATREECLAVLASEDDELMAVLDASFQLRYRYFGRTVTLHVIQNAKSGYCTEDCAYCSQSAEASTAIDAYPMQPAEVLVEAARAAKKTGAYRYCIVASGRAPQAQEIDRLCDVVRGIKAAVDIQVCTSLGLLDAEQAHRLKAAGVDRYNHNLETSARHYPHICTTHTYEDRQATIRTAKNAGLEVCCGGLIGMGETNEDRVDLALGIRALAVDSIPVNFLDPRPGTPLEGMERINPRDALRVLAMFRFVLPDREIRIAGGREACLRSLQPLALYPANSLFTEGYLTTGGQGAERDLAMLRDAGFTVAGWVAA